MSQKVLLIEDDAAIADSISYSLTNEGFEVFTADDGVTGLAAARNSYPDIIILDLMLPKLSGLDLCRTLRKESSVPIIMLTAKTEEVDRVVGLELGADDYVTKPFSTRELIARIRAVLRRIKGAAQEDTQMKLQAGDISVDLARRRVTVGEKPIHLPLKQFELLRTLMSHQDKVLTREYLFQTIWDSDSTYDTGTLDVHIRWLREKIEKDPGRPKYIRTVRGVGYKFVAETDERTY
ncbi:MAG TPA: response regulator transcription factor [Armatimonadota bacterium]|nr:response regulator transcription factor [Armatimonadota bacterium]